MKKVLVLRSEILPYSETFIKEQMLSCKTWHPVLAGIRRIRGLCLSGLNVCQPGITGAGLLAKLQWKLFHHLGFVPPGLISRLKKEAAKLVHVHFGTDAVALWPLIKRLGLPVAITLHGYDINTFREWWEQGHGGRARRDYPQRLLEIALNRSVEFVAVSEAIKRQAISYGIPPEKIRVQHIGVDVERFRPCGEPVVRRKRRILYTGRMVEKKGGEYLIEAFSHVLAQMPDAELVMVGDGPLMDKLRQLGESLRVPVNWRGSLSSDNVKREMDMARVFCLPSITAENGDAEGLPIVLLEAQANGVPVVTSARGGTTEGMIDGKTGFAFSEKDIPALADFLIRVLRDDALAEAMSRAARDFVVALFSLGDCTKSLEGYYDRRADSCFFMHDLENKLEPYPA